MNPGSGTEAGKGRRITQSSLDAVLHRSDIVDLISGFTELKKQGGEFLGRCPFHDERTPSFWVNPAKGVYHCFGCSISGDIITFVQEKQALDFLDAVEFLADRYRVQLEYENPRPGDGERRANKKRLYEVLGVAAEFYHAYLLKSSEAAPARAYLASRNISPETAAAFQLGFSPEASSATSRRALKRGFTKKELADAGLVTGRGGDFFRGRLMVPIIDRADRVVGFGARKLREDQFGGKYINSPDSSVFHKKATVYMAPGLRAAANDAGAVVVVEGYMDVIAMHQAGFPNACAVMGTSLTEQQIVELKRLAPRAYFAFDPDAAGQVATLRALAKAQAHSLDVRVTLLPDGDPADVVGEHDGPERMQELLDHSVSLLHYRVSALIGSSDLSSGPGRDTAYQAALELFQSVPPSPERSEQINRFADRLQLDNSLIQRLQDATAPAPGAAGQPPARQGRTAPQTQQQQIAQQRQTPRPRPRAHTAITRTERLFLAVAMRSAEQAASLKDSPVTVEHFILDVHKRAWADLQSAAASPLDVSRIRDDSELMALVAELGAVAEREYVAADAEGLKAVREELEGRLEERRLGRAIAAIKEAIATGAGEAELMQELAQLETRRRHVNPRLREPAEDE